MKALKTYVKPRLLALSLDGNERLCGDCAGADITLWDDLFDEQSTILSQIGLDDLVADGSLTKSELTGVFSAADYANNVNHCATRQTTADVYCKFTGGTGLTIAWS